MLYFVVVKFLNSSSSSSLNVSESGFVPATYFFESFSLTNVDDLAS